MMLPIALLLLCGAASLPLHVLLCEAQQIDNPLIFVDSELGRDDAQCWYEGQKFPCMTLDFAVEGIQNTSSPTRHPWLYLQEGHYTLSHTAVFDGGSNVADVRILGNDTAPSYDYSLPPVIVNCTAVGNGTGFAFLNIINVTIEYVWFYGCGALQYSTSQDLNGFQPFRAGLYFVLCKNIFLNHVWVTDSPGIGVVIYATAGNNSLHFCNFSNNTVPEHQPPAYPGGGGLYLEFPYCLPGNVSSCTDTESDVPLEYVANSTYNFFDCHFTQNHASVRDSANETFILPHKKQHLAFGRGGGLSIIYKGEAQRNIITVNHSYFGKNRALWGGGLFVEFQDNSRWNVFHMYSSSFHNNSCTYDIAKKKGTGGGGMRIGYIFFGDLHVHDNHMHFDGCDFVSNDAYWGGGTSYYVAREQGVANATNTLSFNNCQWFWNKARLGAAIDLSIWHPVTSGLIAPVNFANTVINFHLELSNLLMQGTIIGLGAMYTDSVPIVFNGYANFTFNEHTALVALSASVGFNKSCHANFYYNRGRNGGAFALFGSAFIRTYNEAVLNFVNNSARQKGGAIYSEIVGEHELISSRNCFIRFEDITVTPNNWSSVFVFTNNTANEKPNSIFTTSVLPCIWGGSYGPDHANTTELFCWNKNWIYNGSSTDCSDQISTAFGMFAHPSYNITIIPGQRKKLSIDMYDDFGRNATDNIVLTASLFSENDNAQLDDAWEYISDDTIKLFGVPNSTAQLDLYTLYPRVIYATAAVDIVLCPPGYAPTTVIPNRTSSTQCVCKTYHECLNSTFQARLRLLGTWIGKYTDTNKLVAGESPYTYHQMVNEILPSDPDELSNFLCTNHSYGVLCGSCKEDYGPSINSDTYECVKCHKNYGTLSWLFFILTEILPLAIFFFILVVFNISLTSGPANAFIFFCQIITTSIHLYTSDTPPYDDFTKIYVIVYDIFNLKFFDPILPHYCLNAHLNTAAVIALKYILAVFPLILILIFYFMIWMYNRGTQPVACLCRPIHRCFARFRSQWDLKRSITDVIAAFLLLSYTKFISVSIQLLSPSRLLDENGKVFKTVLYYDGNIVYFSNEHAPYVIAAIFVLVVFVLFPPVLLLAYPFKIFHKFLMHLTCDTIQLGGKMQLFLYTFYGCYKDGTDSGTRDWRCFAGLYFVLRIVLVMTAHIPYYFYSDWGLQYTLQQLVCIVGLLLFAMARPYRNNFYNNVDIAIFGILASISTLSNFSFYLGDKYKTQSDWIFGIVYFLIWCPLIYMVLYLFGHFWKSYDLSSRFHCRKRGNPANLTLNDISDDSLIRLIDNREPASYFQQSYQQRHNHQPAEGSNRTTERISLLSSSTPGSAATGVATGVSSQRQIYGSALSKDGPASSEMNQTSET